MIHDTDTIVAAATPTGGAIAVIRLSGAHSIGICDNIFRSRNGHTLAEAAGYTVHYGDIAERDGSIVDDVLVSVFRAPRSYTGEDSVEISCHGSAYIVSRIIAALIGEGARAAEAGEFTVRAFLAGKIDLAQAEGIADMIASSDRASHNMALYQMRGGYSAELDRMRSDLLELGSLLELELDFSEEDVEFADRSQLDSLMQNIEDKIARLIDSFSLGNAIKQGVTAAIVGAPNAGKSTLLNLLLKEERAMVSDIAGTTRDSIEECIVIGGIKFRFIDTAGIRSTSDRLEQMGIDRTFDSVRRAAVVLLVCDASVWSTHPDIRDAADYVRRSIAALTLREDQRLITLLNKTDTLPDDLTAAICRDAARFSIDLVPISARNGDGIDALIERLTGIVDPEVASSGNAVVSNARHYEALLRAAEALHAARSGLADNLSADLLSEHIRQVLYHLGTITGRITTDDLLNQIFSKFCIGK